MAYATINKGSSYFNTVLWTGNGGTQTITGVGFQPSLVWGKSRSVNYEQSWIDFVRGGTKYLFSNGTSAESTDANAIQSFNADGITIGSSPYIGNANGATYVGWNWLASNSTVSNTSGTLTSTVSANTTAGFSIVSYTGDGVNNRTVGHGLGATPKFIIIKNRSAGTAFWSVINPRSTSTTDTNMLYLNSTAAEADDTNIMGTNLPNSTTFGIGNYAGVNVNAQDFIAYCWSEIKGFSKFGSYTGTTSAYPNTPFIYTGFKPAFVMIKKSGGAANWIMFDNKRPTYNTSPFALFPNTNSAEVNDVNYYGFDLLSNGFKIANVSAYGNEYNGPEVHVYAAFAENPFVLTDGTPVTAR